MALLYCHGRRLARIILCRCCCPWSMSPAIPKRLYVIEEPVGKKNAADITAAFEANDDEDGCGGPVVWSSL
jgi:hypothetical protein